MTDEEKKATKILEEFKKTGFYMLSIKYDKDRVHTNKMIKNSIETVSNLIQKQEKVIDYMVDRIEWLMKSNGILLDFEHKDNFTKEDIKEFFYRKVEEDEPK